MMLLTESLDNFEAFIFSFNNFEGFYIASIILKLLNRFFLYVRALSQSILTNSHDVLKSVGNLIKKHLSKALNF